MLNLTFSSSGRCAPENARSWLLRASAAPPEPAWICRDCGAAWDDWAPVCGDCGSLGTQSWEPPARARALGLRLPGTEPPPLLLEDEIVDDVPGEKTDTADR